MELVKYNSLEQLNEGLKQSEAEGWVIRKVKVLTVDKPQGAGGDGIVYFILRSKVTSSSIKEE